MSEKPVATPRGSPTDKEIKDLECQPGVTAHTEPKAQFGGVSNRHWLPRVLCRVGWHRGAKFTADPKSFDGSYIAQCACGAAWREWMFTR